MIDRDDSLVRLLIKVNLSNFKNLSEDTKNSIIEILNTTEAARSIYMDRILFLLIPKLNDKSIVQIAYNYISNSTSKSLKIPSNSNIIKKAYDLDKDITKRAVLNNKTNYVSKQILYMHDLTLEEEIKGLKALATGSWAPLEIYEFKYRPSYQALSALSSKILLKVIEVLCRYDIQSVYYNIFSNIAKEKFREMLFVSSIKNYNRFEKVYKKYLELESKQ